MALLLMILVEGLFLLVVGILVVVLVGKRRGKYCNSREKHKNPIIAALSLFDAFMNRRSSNTKYLPPLKKVIGSYILLLRYYKTYTNKIYYQILLEKYLKS